MQTPTGVLEIRFFTVRSGDRAEFDRISREGTVPLMRRCGIDVVAFGPMLNDDDGWLLIRAFPSERNRLADSAAVYQTPEWRDRFDATIPPMIADYRTAVVSATPALVDLIRRGAALG